MPRYSVQPRDRVIVKGHGFLSFAKNMSKNVSENISKNASGKYTQNVLMMLENLQQMHVSGSACSEKVIQKTAESTGDLISNKIAE